MVKSAAVPQFVMKQVCLFLILITYLYLARCYVSGGEPLEKLVLVNGCACFNETITYECTVKGGTNGATVWHGSAFNCTGNDINIFHSSISSGMGTCNNGAIVAQKLGTFDGFYTSQLNVSFSSDLIEKSVECAYSYGQITSRIGAQIITASYPPPDKLYISLADFGLNRLSFTWSPVAEHCPYIKYNILASNCGSCPTIINHTNATCTDVPTDGSTCAFSVQTIVCGEPTGNSSNSILVKMSVPTQPGPYIYVIIIGVFLLLSTIILGGSALIWKSVKKISATRPNLSNNQISNFLKDVDIYSVTNHGDDVTNVNAPNTEIENDVYNHLETKHYQKRYTSRAQKRGSKESSNEAFRSYSQSKGKTTQETGTDMYDTAYPT